jgi:hypothetical protein
MLHQLTLENIAILAGVVKFLTPTLPLLRGGSKKFTKVFDPTPTLPLLRGGSKKFTNDLGLLYRKYYYN